MIPHLRHEAGTVSVVGCQPAGDVWRALDLKHDRAAVAERGAKRLVLALRHNGALSCELRAARCASLKLVLYATSPCTLANSQPMQSCMHKNALQQLVHAAATVQLVEPVASRNQQPSSPISPSDPGCCAGAGTAGVGSLQTWRRGRGR